MNFFSFCRRGALTGMLLLLGITSARGGGLAAPVTDSYGTHTLPSQPLRIVSTSVTLTGSLLAIDAPVVASGATTPNNRVADSRGLSAPVERGCQSPQAGAAVHRRTKRRSGGRPDAGSDPR